MKKWTLILALALMLILQLTAKAANVNLEPDIIDETIGIIDDFILGYLHISGEALTIGGLDNAIIELGDAPIYDLLTGLPISVCDMESGMEVRVAYIRQPGAAPQAVAIWLNPGHEDAAVFTTVVSENIQHGPGYCVFLSADGRYRITLTADTYILCSGYGLLTTKDIVPGLEFFVWVDMITASSPALVFPDKVVLIE